MEVRLIGEPLFLNRLQQSKYLNFGTQLSALLS